MKITIEGNEKHLTQLANELKFRCKRDKLKLEIESGFEIDEKEQDLKELATEKRARKQAK